MESRRSRSDEHDSMTDRFRCFFFPAPVIRYRTVIKLLQNRECRILVRSHRPVVACALSPGLMAFIPRATSKGSATKLRAPRHSTSRSPRLANRLAPTTPPITTSPTPTSPTTSSPKLSRHSRASQRLKLRCRALPRHRSPRSSSNCWSIPVGSQNWKMRRSSWRTRATRARGGI